MSRPAAPVASTFRWQPEDRELIARLRKLTGLNSNADAIRLALRDAIAIREIPAPRLASGIRQR